MNSVKLQDMKFKIHKSKIFLYLSGEKKTLIYNSIKNSKILSNKFNQGNERSLH